MNPDRIRQNGDVFDFSLTDEDMKAISSLETIGRLGPHPTPSILIKQDKERTT